jgi:ribosomal protein L5
LASGEFSGKKNVSKKFNMQSLKEKYNKTVAPELMKKLGYKNIMAVPSIKKVVLNSSFGKAVVGKSASEREKIQNLINICKTKYHNTEEQIY